MDVAKRIADQCESELLIQVEQKNKELLAEKVPEIKCPGCEEIGSFKITSYETENFTTIANLECTNCAFKGYYEASGIPQFKIEDIKGDIEGEIRNLQSSIERLNRR